MFFMPVTKAKLEFILTAEVDLDPSSDLSYDEQLDKIMKDLAENPYAFNNLPATQELHGKIMESK